MKIKRFNKINEDITHVEKPYSVTLDIPQEMVSIMKERGIQSEDEIKDVFKAFISYSTGDEIQGDDTFTIWIEDNEDTIEDILRK